LSKIEVNTVEPQCGTTLTLGGSGDTVQLGTGASQTGFGREGSVNWQTTIKTGDFTAVSGEGYFINTTSGAVAMTLPASPSVGDIVALKDYAGTFQTNNLTINRNSSNIVGEATNKVVSVEGQSIVLVYGDATQGWQPVEAATNSDLERKKFITATGGTISTAPCGNVKIHTFTGPGTFCVSQISSESTENTVGYLVVAGGGGGGGCAGGGGGAGGFREGKNAPIDNFTASPLVASAPTNAVTITATAFPITVGGGGTGQPTPSANSVQGNTSTFSTISSAGGGRGGGRPPGGVTRAGGDGGSGGGNGADHPNSRSSGNTPPVSPPQGKNGGANPSPGTFNMGGTGGAGATVNGGDETGPEPASTKGANGGAGATTSITGSPVAYAGGGGAGGYNGFPGGGGCGGAGGGGRGARPSCSAPASFAVTGTANTGGGGGGGSNQLPGNNGKGAAGGSGIVIIRYKFQ